MSLDAAAAIAANRFGLGAKPGDLTEIASDPRGWLGAQINGQAPLLPAPALKSTAEILREASQLNRERRELREATAQQPSAAQAVAQLKRLGQLYRPIYVAEVQARMRNAVSTQRPFAE